MTSPATWRAPGAAAAALLALGPCLAAAAPELTPPFGARRAHDDAVWFRLRPPFEDPAYVPFAFAPQKDTWLALGEVVGIDVGMWLVSYWSGNSFSKIGFDTIGDNFNKGWIIDTDPYWVNQLGHPLEGMLFYSAARSTGHGFYESFAASFLGSLVWEQFMEVQAPSVNDQITTPIGGTLLGEVLYRMHRLVLDSGGRDPGPWREVGAFLVSPVAGANRFLSGDRFRGEPLLPPSWIGEFRFGMVIGGSATDHRTGAHVSAVGPWASVGGHVVYGVPGTPDLTLRHPLDHFQADFGFAFTKGAEPTGGLQIRGLLLGATLGEGGQEGGLWGLFGSYDITGVPVFKASGVGLGPGVSLMRRWGWFELHGSALAEFLPWAGGGSMEALFARDYHYGPGGKATLELRGHLGDRATVRAGVREYWISGAYASGSSEDITYGTTTLTVRVYGPHAVSATAELSRRHASYPYAQGIDQSAAVWSAHYALLQGW